MKIYKIEITSCVLSVVGERFTLGTFESSEGADWKMTSEGEYVDFEGAAHAGERYLKTGEYYGADRIR